VSVFNGACSKQTSPAKGKKKHWVKTKKKNGNTEKRITKREEKQNLRPKFFGN